MNLKSIFIIAVLVLGGAAGFGYQQARSRATIAQASDNNSMMRMMQQQIPLQQQPQFQQQPQVQFQQNSPCPFTMINCTFNPNFPPNAPPIFNGLSGQPAVGSTFLTMTPGGTVQIFGTGFPASSPVQIIFNGQLLRTQNTDLAGSTVFTMMMPFQASGLQSVQIRSALTGATASTVLFAIPNGGTPISTGQIPPIPQFPLQTFQQQPQ